MLNDPSAQAAATEFTATVAPPAPATSQRSWVPKALILLFLLFIAGLASAASAGSAFFNTQIDSGKTYSQAKCAQIDIPAGMPADVPQAVMAGPASDWRCFPLHGDQQRTLCLTARPPLVARL